MLPFARQRGKQIKSLEHEANLVPPQFRARGIAHFGEVVSVHKNVAARSLRESADHIKQRDFPHPDGPITATDSPGATWKLTPRSAGTSTLPARYNFHSPSVLSIDSTLFWPWLIPGRCESVVG